MNPFACNTKNNENDMSDFSNFSIPSNAFLTTPTPTTTRPTINIPTMMTTLTNEDDDDEIVYSDVSSYPENFKKWFDLDKQAYELRAHARQIKAEKDTLQVFIMDYLRERNQSAPVSWTNDEDKRIYREKGELILLEKKIETAKITKTNLKIVLPSILEQLFPMCSEKKQDLTNQLVQLIWKNLTVTVECKPKLKWVPLKVRTYKRKTILENNNNTQPVVKKARGKKKKLNDNITTTSQQHQQQQET